MRAAELPEPAVNARLGDVEVDFLWALARVIVEVDGRRYHDSGPSFERDRRRDARLAADGYVALRFTWREINERPAVVVARIAQALARRAPAESPPA